MRNALSILIAVTNKYALQEHAWMWNAEIIHIADLKKSVMTATGALIAQEGPLALPVPSCKSKNSALQNKSAENRRIYRLLEK